jgi:hypothetical protein
VKRDPAVRDRIDDRAARNEPHDVDELAASMVYRAGGQALLPVQIPIVDADAVSWEQQSPRTKPTWKTSRRMVRDRPDMPASP